VVSNVVQSVFNWLAILFAAVLTRYARIPLQPCGIGIAESAAAQAEGVFLT
jgi:hypothetical protein